ncbi:hypothetical protein KOI35_30730 [Actinoplanes bogorensis]|uniref:Uncharacterized protein n=1 Tax=Paractinoplanes bogorensis TaxID=1610840 RepID=A0ABS5YWS0_9ACTN|nr:hypothetical protein [Actinoplanes bogorensis]MBU2667895.1 hypothetical protein [Actinoplanes bogorensis]
MYLPLHDPLFWARYTFAHEGEAGSGRLGDLAAQLDDDFGDLDDGDADFGSIEVEFTIGAGCRLMLDFCLELDHHELGILVPGLTEPDQLGWDDLARWHPHALRWSELESLCRAVDGERHPGAALALLCRFTAIFEDDDVEAATAAVEAAYRSLRPAGWTGYWPTAADWLARADLRGQSVTWYTNGAGHWWARQTGDNDVDFCSIRQGSDRFPHEALRTALRAATR